MFNQAQKILILLWLFLGCASFSTAQVRIFEFSDNHSAYDRLPQLLHSIDVLSTQYKAENPSGEVVIIVNGDFGGVSPWAVDQGELGIKALGALAREFKVLYVLGNHDGMDWGNSKIGNQLVIDQLKALHKSNVVLMGANFEFAPSIASLMTKRFDLKMKSEERLRFIGLGLESIFDQSNLNPHSQPQIIKSIKNSQRILKSEILRAQREGVENMVIFQHLGFEKLKSEIALLQNSQVHIPVAFAGHDHLFAQEQVGNTLVVDSQSQNDFSVVDLNSEGQVVKADFYDEDSQRRLLQFSAHRIHLVKIARELEDLVKEVELDLTKVLGYTRGIQENKQNLKRGPSKLGSRVAESLRQYVSDRFENREVISFYNSSSYRRDDYIQEGPITKETILSIYPFKGVVKAFEVSGAEVSMLFKATREHAQISSGSYSPQLSRNLREGSQFSLYLDQRLIDPEKSYVLVLDEWLSRNGYHLEVYHKILKNKRPLLEADVEEVFLETLPEILEKAYSPLPDQKSCQSYLELKH